MPRVSIGDAELYYEDHGSGEPVLLVTGLGGNASFWAAQVPKLAARYRVIVYDHRGSGQSTMSRIAYSAEQMAADALKLLDALAIERCHLVGHSLGGSIGQVIAIENPRRLKSLVISSSWTKADPYFRRIFDVRRKILEDSGIAPYFRSATLFLYPGDWIAGNIGKIEQAEAAMIANAPPLEIILGKIEAVLGFDRTAELGGIRTPTLVNCAADDIITPLYFSKEVAGAIPGAKLEVLGYGAHFCPTTAAEAYFQGVSGFLAAHRG